MIENHLYTAYILSMVKNKEYTRTCIDIIPYLSLILIFNIYIYIYYHSYHYSIFLFKYLIIYIFTTFWDSFRRI